MNKFTLASLFTALALFGCGAQTTVSQDESLAQNPRQEITIANETVEMEMVVEDAAPAQAPLASPVVKMAMEKSFVGDSVVGLASSRQILPILPTEENRENYADTLISNIQQVLTNPVSTFSTDVDTASYTNARRFLSNGQLPPAQAIRVEEFINYFDYQFKSPSDIDEPIAIETELMQTPWNENTKLMRVSLQA